MESLEIKPIIIIVSSSNTKPKSLIKLITGTTTFADEQSDCVKCEWKIDTKYYTAEVDVCGITETYARTEKFNNAVEALIVHMDSNRATSLEDIEIWHEIEADCYPETKLLITNYCSEDTEITKIRATEWCTKRGFELIELYPSSSIVSQSGGDHDEHSDDEIIKEKFGVERIVEALGTHVWSNLVMKDEKINQIGLDNNVEGIENLQGHDEDISDDFTELFSKLHTLKESIKTMPSSQRKKCAENLATAFWRAMGGDEDEISDL